MNDRLPEFKFLITFPLMFVSATALIRCLWLWNPRTNCQDVCLRFRLVLIVEADGAVRTEVVRIARLGRMASLDSIHSAARHHFTLPVDHQVDFLCVLVMMGKVCASRCEVHPEQTRDHVRLVNGIPLATPRTDEQFV